MKEKTHNQLKKEKKLKQQRTFPVGYTILLVFIVALQIALIYIGVVFEPKPQDLIHEYNVTVQPQEDGSLDITYELLWEAVDDSEPLSWVEIGMANENFTVENHTLSDTILQCTKTIEDDYVTAQILFWKSYIDGEMVRFSFTVNQKSMLCQDEQGYFYEFVPGWFNEIRVERYTFTWKMEDGQDIVRQGGLDYGEYDTLFVRYDADAFTGCQTVKYQPFEGDGAYNGLRESKQGMLVVCILFAALLIIAEVYIVDCYVSYGRGRGFIREYGTHVHVHGRTNPGYIRARRRYHATHSSGSGGRGGGCACACACACAGGGRAGCSQKDTFGAKPAEE